MGISGQRWHLPAATKQRPDTVDGKSRRGVDAARDAAGNASVRDQRMRNLLPKMANEPMRGMVAALGPRTPANYCGVASHGVWERRRVHIVRDRALPHVL